MSDHMIERNSDQPQHAVHITDFVGNRVAVEHSSLEAPGFDPTPVHQDGQLVGWEYPSGSPIQFKVKNTSLTHEVTLDADGFLTDIAVYAIIDVPSYCADGERFPVAKVDGWPTLAGYSAALTAAEDASDYGEEGDAAED